MMTELVGGDFWLDFGDFLPMSLLIFFFWCHLRYQNNVWSFICKVIQLLDSGNIGVKTLDFNFTTIIGSMSEVSVVEVLVKADLLGWIHSEMTLNDQFLNIHLSIY